MLAWGDLTNFSCGIQQIFGMENKYKIISDVRKDLKKTVEYTSNAIDVGAGARLLESQE